MTFLVIVYYHFKVKIVFYSKQKGLQDIKIKQPLINLLKAQFIALGRNILLSTLEGILQIKYVESSLRNLNQAINLKTLFAKLYIYIYIKL